MPGRRRAARPEGRGRFVVAGEDDDVPSLARLRVEANPRHGGLRISLWGVDRRREVAGLPPRLRLVGVG